MTEFGSEYFPDFHIAIVRTQYRLETFGEDVDSGMWQGVPTEGKPDLQTRELMDVAFRVPIPHDNPDEAPGQEYLLLQDQIEPNLPWADDHFEERVSRVPSNPGKAYENWPWWRPQKREVTAAAGIVGDKQGRDPGDNFRFDHTYQERFWPKCARPDPIYPDLRPPMRGIRYDYGDLDDVVGQLLEYPYSRQAYLPIFFPEDTGNVHRGRVPCSLGYFFMLRNAKLHMWYTIRSCDFVRHFRDDLYLAARLQLWALEELKDREPSAIPNVWRHVTPGMFHFHCFSLHMHKGDAHYVHNV